MTPVTSDFQIHGLFAHFFDLPFNPNPKFHRHNEIELVFRAGGRMESTIAGHSVVIPDRTLSIFWAGFSHRIEKWEPSHVWTLAIPLAVFLAWEIPQQAFVHRLLHGGIFFEPDPQRRALDQFLMRSWHQDLHDQPIAARQELVLLEAQSRVRRLAASVVAEGGQPPPAAATGRVAEMLRFIAEHYREDVTVAEVAAAAETNPSYAMELFKQSCGMSIMQYTNDQRVSHARRMLVTTDAKVLDVAMESGFGSISQFYNVFQQVCDQSPRDYARTHRAK